jgi:hypothetical protein
LTLANDKAATPGEVEAAMAKAKQIAIENAIELSSIDLTNPNSKSSAGVKVESDTGLKLEAASWCPYHQWVFHVVQKVFGVKMIISTHKQGTRTKVSKIWVIGETTDVAIAKAVFTWLEDLFPKSYREALRTGQLSKECGAARNGFYRGMAAGILEMNKREEEKIVNKAQWGLIVRSKETAIQARVAEEFPDLKASKSRERSHSDYAAALGFQKGKQINLNQIGSTQSSSQLR